jgi:hypothetical protein
MPRKTKRRSSELWTRTAAISSIRTSVGSYAAHQRGADPYIESRATLELSGQLEEVVRDVFDVEFHLYPQDEVTVGTARPAAVGAIIQFRPHLKVVVPFSQQDFDRLWSMALAGHMKYAYLTFTKPHFSTSLVTNISFSTEREE